tara:strand:+ start:40444 stop:40623 length:180 start_codon:yes stop_codon:yes gene_type:complete
MLRCNIYVDLFASANKKYRPGIFFAPANAAAQKGAPQPNNALFLQDNFSPVPGTTLATP